MSFYPPVVAHMIAHTVMETTENTLPVTDDNWSVISIIDTFHEIVNFREPLNIPTTGNEVASLFEEILSVLPFRPENEPFAQVMYDAFMGAREAIASIGEDYEYTPLQPF